MNIEEEKKTNKQWYPYKQWGSYFKLEKGFLCQCLINTDGTADEESSCEVDWERGVNPEDVATLQTIIKELENKE